MKFKTKLSFVNLFMIFLVMLCLLSIYFYISVDYENRIYEEMDAQIQSEQQHIKDVMTIAQNNLQRKQATYVRLHEKGVELYKNSETKNLSEIKDQLVEQYGLSPDSELFLVNRQKVVFEATDEKDIGINLSIFEDTVQLIDDAFANDGVFLSNNVAKDLVEDRYEIYSYSRVDNNTILEFSFLDANSSNLSNRQQKQSSSRIDTTIYSIYKQDDTFFYLDGSMLKNEATKKDFYQKTGNYTEDNYHDSNIMTAFFENKRISFEDKETQTYCVYSNLFTDEQDQNSIEFANWVVEYKVSLIERNHFLAVIKKMFYLTVVLATLVFSLDHIFIQQNLVHPLELIYQNLNEGKEIDIDRLNNSEDEFYMIANQYNQVYGKLNQEIERNKEMIFIDSLTQINNRKAFDITLNEMIENYHSFNKSFCLVIFDIDNFKKINDDCGHLMGDKVLKELSAVVDNNVRQSDFFYRIGGEEFAIIFPEIELNRAEERVNEIRLLIVEHFKAWCNCKVSISAGLSKVEHGDDYNSLYSRADSLLYDAKNAGKNIVKT